MAKTPRALCLDLHTDLQNLDNYADNRTLLAALINTAEEKIAIITAHLLSVRSANGIGGSGVIIDARGEG